VDAQSVSENFRVVGMGVRRPGKKRKWIVCWRFSCSCGL